MKGKTILTGVIWRFAERITAQLVTLVISVVLARLLSPGDYGLLSIVMIFITFTEVLINNGFGTALIQKKNADDIDFSSVFYFQLVFSLVLYFLLFFMAPKIAHFYEINDLCVVLRVIGLRLIISSVNNVQHAYVSKHMLFKKFFLSTIWGTLISGVVGIVMAHNGMGVWALVGQYLTNATVDMVVISFTIPWKPKRMLSFSRLRQMISFSWKILVNAFIDTSYSQLRALVIGKKYTAEDLAFYNKGQQFPTIVENNINMSIESVLFPAIAGIQDDNERVKQLMHMSIKTCSYILCPLLIGLAVISEPFVRLVLTEKWLPCVPYMQIYCIVLMFNPIHTSNIQAIKAIGRSDIVLKINIINKCFGLIALLVSMKYGPLYIAYSLLATSLIGIVVNTFPNRKLLNYGFVQQMKDIMPSFLYSIVMSIPITIIGHYFEKPLITMCVQVFLGIIIYLGISIVTKNESFYYLFGMVTDLAKKLKSKV